MSRAGLTEPRQLAQAIRRLEPSLVSADEREVIVAELREYMATDSAEIRSAAVEAVGDWGGAMEADVIETALFDEAGQVRRTALFTAFASPISTEGIKESLAQIMTSNVEPWELRTKACTALSSYTLEDHFYDPFVALDRERAAAYDTPADDS